MDNEAKSVIEKAMSMELRESFLRHREKQPYAYNEGFDDLKAYIMSDECTADMQKLLHREYDMDPPFHFRVAKNFSARKRDVYAYRGRESYMLKLIAFAMRDHDDMFPDCLYSFRTSLSGSDFLLKLRKFENIGGYYIVKADVSNYVKSIVPELIIPRLEEMWRDDQPLLDFMKFLLLRRECIERDGSIVSCEPGGLGGLPLSNHFMNVYLMELDEYFGPRAALYCRYSDDIVIFAKTREEAESYAEHFLKVLAAKQLSTNQEKTCILEPGSEVDILGCKLKDGRMGISDHSMKKIKRKIRRRANYLNSIKKEKGLSDEEAGRKLVQFFNRVFFGGDRKSDLTWAKWVFPVINDTSSLREIDHYFQDSLRYVLYGSMKKRNRSIPYERLGELGYRSLVYYYHHQEEIKKLL